MTSSDEQSATRPVDERATLPGPAEPAHETRHETRARTEGPTRASLASALRGASQRVAADRAEATLVAEESPATPHGRAWGGQDTLAAGAIVLAPAAVAVMGGLGAPLWLIGLTASALVLAVVVLLWRALASERLGAALPPVVSARRFPPVP